MAWWQRDLEEGRSWRGSWSWQGGWHRCWDWCLFDLCHVREEVEMEKKSSYYYVYLHLNACSLHMLCICYSTCSPGPSAKWPGRCHNLPWHVTLYCSHIAHLCCKKLWLPCAHTTNWPSYFCLFTILEWQLEPDLKKLQHKLASNICSSTQA